MWVCGVHCTHYTPSNVKKPLLSLIHKLGELPLWTRASPSTNCVKCLNERSVVNPLFQISDNDTICNSTRGQAVSCHSFTQICLRFFAPTADLYILKYGHSYLGPGQTRSQRWGRWGIAPPQKSFAPPQNHGNDLKIANVYLFNMRSDKSPSTAPAS